MDEIDAGFGKPSAERSAVAATVDPSKAFAALAEIIYQGSDSSEVYAATAWRQPWSSRAATTPAR